MINGITKFLHRSILTGFTALPLCLLLPGAGSAQQYLGNARQKCSEQVTVTAPGLSIAVRQFESRSADVSSTKIGVQCGSQRLSDVDCPANTNKILVDRSQGGSVFSIICLQK